MRLFKVLLPLLLLAACGQATITSCPPGHVCESESRFFQAPASQWGFGDGYNAPAPSWRSAPTAHLSSGKDGPTPVEFSDIAATTAKASGREKPQSCPYIWKNYGHDPWFDPTRKDPEGLSDAMKIIKKETNLPDEVAKKLLELAKADNGTNGSLKKGDMLDVMAYGRGGKDKTEKFKRCVEVAFKEGASTREYSVTHEDVTYTLVKPERCVNWALRKGKKGGVS